MRIKGFRYAQHIYGRACELDAEPQPMWVWTLRTRVRA